MTRVHCPTCTCGQEAPVEVDTSAPFYALVLEVDAICHREAQLRAVVTKARNAAA